MAEAGLIHRKGLSFTENESEAIITVAGTGIGIPHEEAAANLDRFFGHQVELPHKAARQATRFGHNAEYTPPHSTVRENLGRDPFDGVGRHSESQPRASLVISASVIVSSMQACHPTP